MRVGQERTGHPSSGRGAPAASRSIDRTVEIKRPAETRIDVAAEASDDIASDDPVDVSGGILIDPSGAWPAPDISTQMPRPSIVERQCSRTGCSESAAVTLSYHYAQSQVWIDFLWPEREPHMYDLCERHAERLSVPRGWHLDDRRRGRHVGLIAV